MLSGPPETATAISGRASKPPIAARLAANSDSVSGAGRTAGYTRGQQPSFFISEAAR